MKDKVKALIETRKIIALAVVTLFCILSYRGTLDIPFVQTVIIAVISFYFGKSTALDKPKE